MKPQFPNSAVSAEQSLRNGNADFARTVLGLLGELEQSLRSSQDALLSRDIARLEQDTRQQILLRDSLEAHYSQRIDVTKSVTESRNRPQAALSRGEFSRADDALAAQLHSAQKRVLHLGRVQSALLGRAQRSLRILSNFLAGREAIYAAPACDLSVGAWSQVPARRNTGCASAPGQEKESSQCRA